MKNMERYLRTSHIKIPPSVSVCGFELFVFVCHQNKLHVLYVHEFQRAYVLYIIICDMCFAAANLRKLTYVFRNLRVVAIR